MAAVKSIAKKQVSFRLAPATTEELEKLAKREKISQADIIGILVHAATMGFNADELDQCYEIARRI